MVNPALVKYLIAFLESSVPLTDHAYYERLEITKARYESIAETIAEVSVEAPLFADDADGVKTGALLASIAGFEGALRDDIDNCKRGGDPHPVTKVYQAWTLWQLHANKEKVCASRVAGARVAREMIRHSFKTCHKLAVPDRLSVYTDGVCKSNWSRSRHRMERASRWVSTHPFTSETNENSNRQFPGSAFYLYDGNSRDCNCNLQRHSVGVCYISPTCDCSN